MEDDAVNYDLAGELCLAAISGDTILIQSLVAESTASERQQCLDMALTIVAEKGIGEACEVLIKNGANPNCRDISSFTPLISVIEASDINDWQTSFVCETLCQNGADVDLATLAGITPLMKAVTSEKRRTLQMLVYKIHANVNAQDEDGRTALMKAAAKGNVDFCQIILTHGADINAKDVDGATALIEAVVWEDTTLSRTLIRAGADVNVRGTKDITPLMVAATMDWSENCRCLIEHGADLNAVNSFGETAAQLAKRLGQFQALSTIQAMSQPYSPYSPRPYASNNTAPTKTPSLIATLTVVFSVLYAFCCLAMLLSGGTYLLFELAGMLFGYLIWRGGNKEKSFWTVWLLATFISLLGLILGPVGALVSVVARLIIIRFIR